MDHTIFVSVCNGLSNLLRDRCRFLRRKRTVFDSIRQTSSLNKPHREVVLPIVLPDFVDWYDSRMIQISCRFRLRVKATNLLFGRLPVPPESSSERQSDSN